MPWESIAPGGRAALPEPERKPSKKTVEPIEAPAKKKGMWSYTLLHVVILAVVAFVLGMIIWKLLTNGGSPLENSMGEPTSPATTYNAAVW